MTRLLFALCLLTSCRTARYLQDGRLPVEQIHYVAPPDSIRPLWLRPYRPSNYLPPHNKKY